MSQVAPKCIHVSEEVYHFEYPSEDKIRTPSLFEEQIKRFGARSKDANDELKFIAECIPDCKQEVKDAKAEMSGLNEQIAELEKEIRAENRKNKPDLKKIANWREEISSHKESVKAIAEESAEWAKSETDCGKLKGEWEKELKSLRKIQDKLLKEWQKGSPWLCGAPTSTKPPGHCKNKMNYIDGRWVPCHLHR